MPHPSVKEFDANLDTFIQLNSSKVPAQKKVYSLVVGAGGTGLDTLLETKGLINKTCCLDKDHKSSPTDHVRYLAFDTDNASLTKVSSQQTGGAILDEGQGEFVQMKSPNIGVFLSAAYRNQVPSYISSWLDFSIDPTHSGEDGAGGIRQCGRLLMFRNIERVRTAISSAIRGMVADKEVGALNIYLLSGVAGGTGSGTFLDLAYIARDVAEGIAPSRVTMYGYLILPDVNLSRPMPEDHAKYAMKNGYAALKELDYLMNLHQDGGRFVQRYSPNYIVDTEKSPFNYVHLVSGTGADGLVLGDSYREGMRAVAQSIVSFVAEEQEDGVSGDFAMKSHYANISHGAAQHSRKHPERNNCYLALGTYSYELPVDKLLLYVTCLLFRKMEKMFEQDPSVPEIDAAYSALGLVPNNLLGRLVREEPSIAPDTARWEHLFGKNAIYDLVNMSKGWISRMIPVIESNANLFMNEFPEQFDKMTGGWFVDPNRGPIWVNHLITLNSGNLIGLEARLTRDFSAAAGQISKTQGDITKIRGELNEAAEDARTAGAIMGKREEKTRRYIELINQHAKLNARLAALVEMQKIYKNCLEVILERNKAFFDVIVNVLEAMKDICERNAQILTRTELNAAGDHFTWQPLSVPDVSADIERAFDAKGDTDQTISMFCKAVYEKAYEWASGNINVKAFIRDYLDSNLADIANRSLEEYIKVVLRGEDLEKSVIKTLGPNTTGKSVPLIALTENADVGGKFWLLSVPYSCTGILDALKKYSKITPDMAETLTIQSSGINSRIFAQSILSAVPMAAYSKLTEYELVYLSQYGNSGKHLYMGEKENWENLPNPIPYRSRPKKDGAYPPAVQAVEDERRELFRKCRKLPIIRQANSSTGTVYMLYIAKLPNLDEEFAEEKLRDEKGRLDPLKARDAIEKLKGWMETGLPDRDLSDSVHNASYPVASCAIPGPGEADERETEACECFLGEYNNIRRGREELEKYQKVQDKLDELNAAYAKISGAVNKARQTIQMLVSGVVKLTRAENNESYYNYVLEGRERPLVEIGRRRGWREAVLAEAVEELSGHKEPMKRELCDKLVTQAEMEYRQMDAQLESAREKLRKLSALRKGVEERCVQLRDDLMDEIQEEDVDRETLTFYEKLSSQLEREERYTKGRIVELTNIEEGIDDEF